MLRPSRGLMLQDFVRDGEDLLDSLLATAQRPAHLQASSGQPWPVSSISSGQTHATASSLGSSAHAAPLSNFDVASLQHYKSRVGPELRQMRRAQGASREYYTLDHLSRLKQFEAQAAYTEGKCSDYCKDYHAQPCTACTTCHFCRQKTVDPKTFCPCYYSKKRIVGGKGRGFWCGSCLYIRMGENIHEVKGRKDWRCPCCRDICNCSGANCLRARRNLAVTNQLIHEAIKQGFKSVAHYLILTHLSEQGDTMPMLDITNMRKRDRPDSNLTENPVFKQARLAYDVSQEARHRTGAKFHETAAQHIRKQLQLLAAELPLPRESDAALASMAAAGFGSHVLEDDQCEENEDASSASVTPFTSPPPGRIFVEEQSVPKQAAGQGNSRVPWQGTVSSPPPGMPSEQGAADALQAHHAAEEAFFVSQDGTSLPRNSFAACAWGMAPSSSQAPAGGMTAARQGSTTTESAGSRGAASSAQAAQSNPMQDSITIDSSGPWDGRHPGLATAGLSSAEQHHRRSRFSLVRLPQSMLPPRRTVPLRQIPSASRATASEGETQQQSASYMHSMHSSPGLSTPNTEDPSGDPSAIQVRPTGAALSASGGHSEQPQPAENQDTLQPRASAANACQSPSEAQDVTMAQTGSQPLGGASQGMDDAGQTSATGSNARLPVASQGIASAGRSDAALHVQLGPPAAAGAVSQGQLGDLPDKPGHLATAELCQAANGGVCWHLLQMAIKARLIAGKNDVMQQGYVDLLPGLLDKMTQGQTESVGVTDPAFAALMQGSSSSHASSDTAASSNIKSHMDLKHAIAILLLAAEALPETEVHFSVCRLLFNQEPFVDFIKSDLRARAMLIKASFDMFAIMQERGFQVQGVCKGIMHILGSLAGEYEELLKSVAVKQEPMMSGQELQVGPFCMTAATSPDEARDQMAVLVSLAMGNEDLLKVFLQYIRITCSGNSPQVATQLLGPEVASLLDSTRVVRPEVRHGALAAVYAAMTAAMKTNEGRLLPSQLSEVRLLGQHIEANLLRYVEQLLLVDFPLRTGSAADSLDLSLGFKLDEVSVSLKVEVLARAHALLLQTGLCSWTQLEQYAMKPFHPHTFWKHANTLYRHFTVFFLAHALQAFPDLAAFTSVAVQVLRIWVRSMVDDGRRNALKHFTLVRPRHAERAERCSAFHAHVQ